MARPGLVEVTVYVVIADGPIVLGAYTTPGPAHIHMRCVTGASVMAVELLDLLPTSVRDDIADDEGDDTPVTNMKTFGTLKPGG